MKNIHDSTIISTFSREIKAYFIPIIYSYETHQSNKDIWYLLLNLHLGVDLQEVLRSGKNSKVQLKNKYQFF